ncbi:CDP-glycerol glycerophosphotransferase family protein [Pseudalkalibacillus sp. SCS-8]|uniref:CDP-glycerol glycerophosphotransferase family protein n=1 Tax=Pseudalkalibacillus nanhaiensis TaxID=3115291 RepID=UPI0032DABCF0
MQSILIQIRSRLKEILVLMVQQLMMLFPIKKNKLFFYSYYGAQYGCNPKYITEYIRKHYPEDHFRLVWAFHQPDEKPNLPGVKKVKTMSLSYFYELCTSKVIITNFRTTNLFRKRKGQYYIQTWHSSIRLKKSEKDTEASLPTKYVKMAVEDSEKCDLLLSGSQFSSELYKRAFWYDGEIFEHGTPRNDLLVCHDLTERQRILKKLDLSEKDKVLLFAPTFRNHHKVDIYDLDYRLILKTLNEISSANWNILVRLHPHLYNEGAHLAMPEKVTDVSKYDDTQELLSIADILITDYSSLMFDYSLTRRPCFLHTPDLKEYLEKERGLYFQICDLPFPHALNNEQLIKQMQEFDDGIFQQKLEQFMKETGSYEKGEASYNLVKKIESICYPASNLQTNQSKPIQIQ